MPEKQRIGDEEKEIDSTSFSRRVGRLSVEPIITMSVRHFAIRDVAAWYRRGDRQIFIGDLLCLFLLLTLAFSVPGVAAQGAAINKRLDAVIDRAVRDERIVGVTMLVAQNGEVIYRRTAGLNDREAKKALRQDAVFRLASITKLIVSVAALALIERPDRRANAAERRHLAMGRSLRSRLFC